MLDRALAVRTLAGCEKYLGEWGEVARLATEAGDDEGRRFAFAVCDRLLDLQAVLTEHVDTARVAA